jgi:hypothetical protein
VVPGRGSCGHRPGERRLHRSRGSSRCSGLAGSRTALPATTMGRASRVAGRAGSPRRLGATTGPGAGRGAARGSSGASCPAWAGARTVTASALSVVRRSSRQSSPRRRTAGQRPSLAWRSRLATRARHARVRPATKPSRAQHDPGGPGGSMSACLELRHHHHGQDPDRAQSGGEALGAQVAPQHDLTVRVQPDQDAGDPLIGVRRRRLDHRRRSSVPVPTRQLASSRLSLRRWIPRSRPTRTRATPSGSSWSSRLRKPLPRTRPQASSGSSIG